MEGPFMRIIFTAALFVSLLAASLSCDREGPADVVIYTSIDEPVAREIIGAFESQTGYRVQVVTDTEATKSIGLAERLRAEKDRPQADVWWGNEPFHTIALAEEGLLAAYDSPSAAEIDPQFRDAQNRWAGNGLRARVVAIHGGSEPLELYQPDFGLESLLREEYRDAVTLARPTAGTTGSHVAALYVLWGQEKADAFFRGLRENGATLVGSNSQVAQQVAQGNYRIGLTDNDDVANALATGGDVRAVLPDQAEDAIGTLTIPTTVGLVAGRPENDAARRLTDFLLSSQVERLLAEKEFTAYSVRGGEGSVKSLQVDYAEVSRRLPEAVRRATALLEGREP